MGILARLYIQFCISHFDCSTVSGAWNVGSAALSMIHGTTVSNAYDYGMFSHGLGSSVMVMMVAVRCVVAPPR
jgi:hypothetical protein